MIDLKINGIPVSIDSGLTILEVANFFGIPIPTLCHVETLPSYGACRLCVVEIGEGAKSKLVTSCTYPAEDGMVIRTASNRVLRARKIILELLLSTCPQSKTIQDLASFHNIKQQRFRQEYDDCILCGLCVRMCESQMQAKAIGFRGRGENRTIGIPFDIKSEECRLCGACEYICPACQLRCTYTEPDKVICGGCANLSPPCAAKEQFDDMMCYLSPCVACEIAKN